MVDSTKNNENMNLTNTLLLKMLQSNQQSIMMTKQKFTSYSYMVRATMFLASVILIAYLRHIMHGREYVADQDLGHVYTIYTMFFLLLIGMSMLWQ